MTIRQSRVIKRLYDYRAVLFDLDGVLTPTAVLHRKAWNTLFTAVLPLSVDRYTEADYFMYVDGKPRYDGVAAVLRSRGIELPWGSPTDSPDVRSVCGYGNRKNEEFERMLHDGGIAPYDDVKDVLIHLRAQGLRMGVVSSSRNAREVLAAAGIERYFDEVVDAAAAVEHHLQGKPAPDTYVFGARQLSVHADQTVVVEDALSGVASGAAGGFGLVIGVDRGAGGEALREAGADVVVDALHELLTLSQVSAAGSTMRGGIQGDQLDPVDYPIEMWSLVHRGRADESGAAVFSVSNGAIGIRGAGDKARCLGSGTFLSGFHETYPLHYPESAYGYAHVGQIIQGVPDATDFTFYMSGVACQTPRDCWQRLDFRSGISTEHREYRSAGGSPFVVDISRCVSFTDQHLVLVGVDLWCGHDMSVSVDAKVNTNPSHHISSDDPRKTEHVDNAGLDQSNCKFPKMECPTGARYSAYRCRNSHMTMAMGVVQLVDGDEISTDAWTVQLHAGVTSHITRVIAYHAYPLSAIGVEQGLSLPETVNQDPEELIERCGRTLRQALMKGASGVLHDQRAWLDEFWKDADVQIEANDGQRIQQIVRWELFQLAQSTVFIPNGIPAKGLSGSGYSGHSFWDTEIFVLPFLTYTRPEQARRALEFRHRMLPAARKRAAALHMDGALFPWRSINGEEGSAFFPAGTAQYHLDADVAFAVAQYLSASKDYDFLLRKGIDILVETARMWTSLGHVGRDRKFHINCVTGPDEYSALVDDNYFTNVMAKFNLQMAFFWVDWIIHVKTDEMAAVFARLAIQPQEWLLWRNTAEMMALQRDVDTGVDLQDSAFMSRERWDFVHDQARPLLLHYHPLTIYRHQVLKQADVVLALILLSSQFTPEQKRRDFDYYDPLTTGDSTLSASCQSIVAAEVGHEDEAMKYFLRALFTDVADLHANTTDGIHMACAGGVWSAVVSGFGGFRDSGGMHVSVDPKLPSGWKGLTYQLALSGGRLQIHITHDGVEVIRLEGDPIQIEIQGQLRVV